MGEGWARRCCARRWTNQRGPAEVNETPYTNVAADLATVRCQFHALLDSLSQEDWDNPSRNPAWTNGQLVYHMLFAFMLIPSLFWMIRFWSRLPGWASRGFAAVLNFSTPLFDRVNALGPRGQERLFGRERASRLLDRRLDSIDRKARSLRPDRWQAGMHYPRRWDPAFGDFMTYADLFAYPGAHFRKHLGQMSAGDVSGC